jgi:anthranilate phosphoribosyltransferase
MFAPHHHQAMRFVIPVRKELAVRTIFNFLGPLTNPAGATRQLIGVSDDAYLDTIAAALGELGGSHGMVVSSADGLDELSVSGATHVVELRNGTTERRTITPEEVGVEPAAAELIRSGDPEHNASVTRGVLRGEHGPERSLTLMNAGAAIYVAGKADSIADGVKLAVEAIDSGAATDALERYVARTRTFG